MIPMLSFLIVCLQYHRDILQLQAEPVLLLVIISLLFVLLILLILLRSRLPW